MSLPPQLLHKCCSDGPLQWLTAAGWVEGSGGDIQRIVPNILQRRAGVAWTARYRRQKPVRIIGLKPRKRGFSTISTATHHWMMRIAGAKVGLLGHQDNASTQTLFEMLQVYRDNDSNAPMWGNRPTRASETNIRYSNGAAVRRLSAEKPAKVRSATLQAISATEWAYWNNSEKTLTAAMNALGKGVFSSFIGESTPNGVTGSFYTTWQNARWPTPDECPEGIPYWKQWEAFLPYRTNDSGIPDEDLFVRIFAAWFEFADSHIRLTPVEQRAVLESIDREDWYYGEQDLIDRYGLARADGQKVLGAELRRLHAEDQDRIYRAGETPPYHPTLAEQLAWRRRTIRNDCNNDRRKFDEEYPSDPHTCFLSSGYPYFDTDSITTLDLFLKHTPPPTTGIIDWKHLRRPEAGVTWRETRGDDATVHLWEHPIEGCAYLVVIDSATGEANVKDGDPDRHSILVYRQAYRDHTGTIHRVKLVARIRPPCLVPLHTAAEWAARLATYYQALIVPEINNTGMAIVVALRQFPHVLIATVTLTEDPRSGRRIDKTIIGHFTDEVTRQVILDHLHKCLRAEFLDILCPHAIYELRIFAKDPNKPKPQAPEGQHDDDVMATAIALHWIDKATVYVHPTKARRDIHRDHPRASAGHRHRPAAMNS